MNEHNCIMDSLRPDLAVVGKLDVKVLHLRCILCLRVSVVGVRLVSQIENSMEVVVMN